LQARLDEFWVATVGMHRRVPKLCVEWLFGVEEMGWPPLPEYLAIYGIE